MIALAVLALAMADAAPVPEPEPPVAASTDNAGGATEVIAAFQAAQAERGSLEGRWRVARPDGAPLYLIELADSGGAPDPRAAAPDAPKLEGAWLDLGRAEALTGAGYLAAAKQTRRRLMLLFFEGRRHAPRVIRLRADGDGGWSGGLLAAGRRSQRVIMTRDPLLGAGS
jgi:hypothetical protein